LILDYFPKKSIAFSVILPWFADFPMGMSLSNGSRIENTPIRMRGNTLLRAKFWFRLDIFSSVSG
jgi:hypothetical protein